MTHHGHFMIYWATDFSLSSDIAFKKRKKIMIPAVMLRKDINLTQFVTQYDLHLSLPQSNLTVQLQDSSEYPPYLSV